MYVVSLSFSRHRGPVGFLTLSLSLSLPLFLILLSGPELMHSLSFTHFLSLVVLWAFPLDRHFRSLSFLFLFLSFSLSASLFKLCCNVVVFVQQRVNRRRSSPFQLRRWIDAKCSRSPSLSLSYSLSFSHLESCRFISLFQQESAGIREANIKSRIVSSC